jgi:Lysozyme like domain/LysM domain
VSSIPRHRRKRKIRRTGQHTAPSQVEKVAQTAGKAAPVVVAAGAIAAAAPQVSGPAAATATAAGQHPIRAHLDAAIQPSRATGRSYTVRAGDTLSAIAQRFYGHAADWRGLYAANQPKISDPGLIYVGQELSVPRHLPASAHTTAYTPQHATAPASGGSADNSSQASSAGLSGTLGCTGLEALWREAGGSPAAEVTAASIAMAESGGNQFATGTVGERGYWQINPVNGALSTYDALGNAHAAVVMSGDGTNWSPWSTFTSGVYAGRC